MSHRSYICDGARTEILVTISQKVSDSLRDSVASVATCLRFCEIFNDYFVVNLLLQQFWTSASIWQSYWQKDTDSFWSTVCKTVPPMLSDSCLSVCLSCLVCPVCLSIYNVGALWPNGLMGQDETWHAGIPRPWPHCFRWGPSSPTPKGHSHQFSAHICCGQMAGWIKIPHGREVGLGPATLC